MEEYNARRVAGTQPTEMQPNVNVPPQQLFEMPMNGMPYKKMIAGAPYNIPAQPQQPKPDMQTDQNPPIFEQNSNPMSAKITWRIRHECVAV